MGGGLTNPEAAAAVAETWDTAIGEALAEALLCVWIFTVLTGELGAEALAIFKPLTLAEVAGERASTDSLLLRLATLLTATMFFPAAVKLFPPADKATAGAEVDDDVGVIMTKVGPLAVGLEGCMATEVALLVEEATTSGNCATAGGLGEDLNLLSRMESNSANCSIVLDDMDLTMVCPTDLTVLSAASVLLVEAVEIIVEEGSEGRVDVEAAVVTMTFEAGAVLIPSACGGTVTSRLPCLIIHRPVALCTKTCLSPQC